ncbi:unnamed protein product [Acanthoscelides obtectus]|uniref:C2H2-type domain-containing protein n=1 Tax=Acanthoscelides obtectus TaxID=200917 RepID=A0A9P0PVS4_ACAOB|nr:unnamed protein product [Acanthoscelides obtectus]CAK1634041.1 Zinc finger Y-chromosomal protein 1 [Acanthoscelides obtectus]
MEGTSESKEKLQSPTTMDNDRLAAETAVKIEVVEVKQEVPEMMESESFGVDPSTVALPIKEEDCKNSDRIDINRIKNEPVEAENWGECAVKEEPGLDLTDEELEEEMNQDYRVFIKDESTSEYIVGPDEQDSAVKHEILKKHPVECKTENAKLFSCYDCMFTVSNKNLLIKHMKEHKNVKHARQRWSRHILTCTHCNSTFKQKFNMDDHIIRKHPEFISSVSSKIHQCTHCSYKTTKKSNLTDHIETHSETCASFSTCTHCSAPFKTKKGLYHHILQNHPDFISSISSKIHRCTLCDYKTTYHSELARHKLKHPEVSANYKFNKCTHCDAKFTRKAVLKDHIFKEHSDSIPSISTKIHQCIHCGYKTTRKSHLTSHMSKHPDPSNTVYECTQCSYKTTRKSDLTRHTLRHPGLTAKYKLSKCTYCDSIFKNKAVLSSHIIKMHPEFIASVPSKVHQCTHCSYKTTRKFYLTRHTLKNHPSETYSNYKLTICSHCKATFTSKQGLDEHIVRKHPDLVASVTKKVYECTHCTFKTLTKIHLNKHMSKKTNCNKAKFNH